MSPYVSPAIAALLLLALPRQAFSRKGLLSARGLARYVGHACVAGIPGGLYLAAEPGASLETVVGLTLAGVVGAGTMMLAPLFQRPHAPRASGIVLDWKAVEPPPGKPPLEGEILPPEPAPEPLPGVSPALLALKVRRVPASGLQAPVSRGR